ncbi:hypothetical protein Lal_00008118 [Lupinus albus]|nr:hypothetical protein Lal_00008118 [Lupinus albus]
MNDNEAVLKARRNPGCGNTMLTLTKRLHALTPFLFRAPYHLRSLHRRRHKSPPLPMKKLDDRSEWWIVDGEMHEIGEQVPVRERFVIPRENIPNKRRKQLREQFMRRTRLVLKESEHDPWCKKYMELYNELRENWERLYWEEGYSKKLGQDHANYESAEDDNDDFSPYRSRRSPMEHSKEHNFVRNGQSDTWEKASLIRDKFEYDRERRMREKAFAPMHGGAMPDFHASDSRNQPLNADRYFSQTERNWEGNK